jgi:hypothetical protein
MPLRIRLLPRLRRAHPTLRKFPRLIHLPRRRIHRAALALGNRAVVASACAVFDGAAGEFGGHGFVDAGVGCYGGRVSEMLGGMGGQEGKREMGSVGTDRDRWSRALRRWS